jgi:5-methyltetrahydrofolate--homocysteine methyltransferase
MGPFSAACQGGEVERLVGIREGTAAGRAEDVLPLVRQALADGVAPAAILQDGLIAAMDEVGRRFERGDCFIPEMLLSARVMKAAVEVLRPRLVAASVEPIGRIVIGTMQGDLHDIGKNLVGMMLEGAGFEVIDLGSDVAPDRFVDAVRRHRPGFVGFSALLTTTMPNMGRTIAALAEAGLRGGLRVVVGGAPVTADFARQIGADLYAPSAVEAAQHLRAAARAAAAG